MSDPYVKAIRWASDRIKDEGIVALVTNSGFVDGLASDGMRAHLSADFDEVYILHLGGNVRKNQRLSGTTHNVFGIQVGVSINLFIRRNTPKEKRKCRIFYVEAEGDWTRWEKYAWLDDIGRASGTAWKELQPDSSNRWLTDGNDSGFESFLTLEAMFDKHSRGLATSRDVWTYSFDEKHLASAMSRTIDFYNSEVDRWKRTEDKRSLSMSL